MANIKRVPNESDSFKTIVRSIKARGGMAPKDRIIHALVYNYFDHLTVFDQRRIATKPEAYDTKGWVEFHGMMMRAPEFKPLRDTAERYFQDAIFKGVVKVATLYDKNNRGHAMYMLPDTKISIGA